MKKVFSIFLIFTNLFLSKSLICLAEPNEKVTSKKVVTLEKKKKKAEEKKSKKTLKLKKKLNTTKRIRYL